MFSKLGLVSAFAAIAAALPAAPDNVLPGKYIVRLKHGVESTLAAHTEWVSHVHSRNLVRRGGNSVGIEQTYKFCTFEGYAGSFDEETLAEIKANPDVRHFPAIPSINGIWSFELIHTGIRCRTRSFCLNCRPRYAGEPSMGPLRHL